MYRKKIALVVALVVYWILFICPIYSVAAVNKSDSVKGNIHSTDSSSQSKAKGKSLPTKTAKPNVTSQKTAQKAVSANKSGENKSDVLSAILIRIAESVPKTLKKPIQKIRSVLRVTKNNSGKLIFLFVSIVIILFALFFFRQRVEKNRFMTTTRLSVMDKEVQRACRYIENNYFDFDLTVDSLCELMVTGQSFLTALFEKELGMNVDDFIKQVRVNRAKILLNKDSTLDIDYIALKSGFCEIEDFKKAFSALSGVDIEEFRKSLSTGDNGMQG